MCEGKFLVKTSVTTDNVIRQVTVEHFRFGVRVIKKPEGRWVCQDLNRILTSTPAASDSSLSLAQANNNEQTSPPKRTINNNYCQLLSSPVAQEGEPEKSNNNNNNSPSSGSSCRNNIISRDSKETTSSSQGVIRQEAGKTSSEKLFVPSAPSIVHEGTERRPTLTSRDKNEQEQQRQQQQQQQEDRKEDIKVIAVSNKGLPPPQSIYHSQSKKTGRDPSLDSILYRHLSTGKDLRSPGRCHPPSRNSHHHHTDSSSKRPRSRLRLDHPPKDKISLKSQLLSDILGPSPLLKLQLLNLYVAPLEGGHKFPELLPLPKISRLRMLFDENGSEKGGNSSETPEPERDPKRLREGEGDPAEATKRVKLEPEDEDNLVIDENVGFGEDLSINSEESNEGTQDNSSLAGISQENDNNTSNSVAGKRPSLESPTEFSNNSKSISTTDTSIKKNGLDVSITRVPKSTSNSNQSSKNFEECSNSADSNSSVNEKVLRLEKEIQGMASLLKTKEQEWNAIVRLKKLKELEVEFLRRQKEIEDVFDDDTIQQHEEYLKKLEEKISTEGSNIGPGENDVRSSIHKTDKEVKEAEKRLKNTRVNPSSKKENKDSKQSDGNLENFKASLALQQLCERNRNSLAQANSPVQLPNNANMQNKVIGEGRQGTIVEVRSIIADYRSKNPEETASNSDSKRRPQKKGSSSQQQPSSSSSIISQNQNVSFKDVLVNLAKLSQNEKAGVVTSFDNIAVTPSRPAKGNNTTAQTNSYNSSRGQVGTTLAKLLSSNNSSSSLPVGIVHPDDGNSVASLKIEAVNHSSDSNLSLANLLASAKCRDDEIKTDDDEMVPICQGCNTNRAQFVCAGCGNQWYCCRECQLGKIIPKFAPGKYSTPRRKKRTDWPQAKKIVTRQPRGGSCNDDDDESITS